MTGFRASLPASTLRLEVDGKAVDVPRGATVAGALLLAGRVASGPHPVSGDAEGPWCLMGVCFGCLVEIDGIPDRQACLVEASAGMVVRSRGGRG